jgi:D-glycero-alpha-D-manno-heptose-7-phosphate kinase
MEVSRSKLELAEMAIDIEHNVLHERVGIQDQLHAAFGGLNHFTFEGDRFEIRPIHARGEDLDRLSDWLVLVYTGTKRRASEVLKNQITNTADKKVDAELEAMVALVDEGHRVLEANHGDDLPIALAGLLRETWDLKKRLSPRVSSTEIDALYDLCCRTGALAGKLCGAGSGGFLLMVVPPDRRADLAAAVGEDRCVSFRIEHSGSVVSHRW